MAEPGKKASVLVVDDDFILLDIVTTLFRRAGLRVFSASSGEAALTILRDKGPAIDWLFTDIVLPGYVNGWTVADQYRLSYPFRPIVYASTAARRDHRTVQGSIFVEKPFQPLEILRLADMLQNETEDFVAAIPDPATLDEVVSAAG